MTLILIPRTDTVSAKLVAATDWEKYFKSPLMYDHIMDGLVVSAATGLSVDITAGNARVLGLHLSNTATANKGSLTASTTNYLYMKVTRAGSLEPESWDWFVNTVGGAVTDAMMIAKIVTGVSTVTSVSQTPADIGYQHNGFRFVGTGAEIAALTRTWEGMKVVCTVAGSGFIAGRTYTRDATNTVWVIDGIFVGTDQEINSLAKIVNSIVLVKPIDFSNLGTEKFSDDFASYASQAAADIVWEPLVYGGTDPPHVNVTNDNIDFIESDITSTRPSANYDLFNTLGYGNYASDHSWVLRFKLTFATLTAANLNNIKIGVGLSTEAATFDYLTGQGYILFETRNDSASGLDFYTLDDPTTNPNGKAVTGTFTTTPAVTTYYIELKRTSRTTYACNIFSNSAYTSLTEGLTATCSPSIVNLRYIKVMVKPLGSGTGNVTGTVDDVKFWNGEGLIPNEKYTRDNTNSYWWKDGIMKGHEFPKNFVHPEGCMFIDNDVHTQYHLDTTNRPSGCPQSYIDYLAESAYTIGSARMITAKTNPIFYDDFSLYVDNTVGDKWLITNAIANFRITPANDNMLMNVAAGSGTNSNAYFDLGASVSNQLWVMRFKWVIATVTANTTNGNNSDCAIGLSDTGANNIDSAQDFLGLVLQSLGTGDTKTIHAVYADALGVVFGTYSASIRTAVAETLYVEIKRISATSFKVELFSDSTFSTSLGSATPTPAQTIKNLRYIKFMSKTNVVEFVLTSTIDEIGLKTGTSTW